MAAAVWPFAGAHLPSARPQGRRRGPVEKASAKVTFEILSITRNYLGPELPRIVERKRNYLEMAFGRESFRRAAGGGRRDRWGRRADHPGAALKATNDGSVAGCRAWSSRLCLGASVDRRWRSRVRGWRRRRLGVGAGGCRCSV